MTTELILPSGAFATIRPLTWADWLMVRGVLLLRPDADTMSLFATRCVTIDDEKPTVAQIMGMDLRDAIVLAQAIQTQISGPVRKATM